MSPTISAIADFLRKSRTEDPVKSSAKERVLRDMAEGVKKNVALPKGYCHLCSRYTSKMVPAVMRACKRCTSEFLRRGHTLKTVERKTGRYSCDYCLKKTDDTIISNPFICGFCAEKISRTHRNRRITK